MNEMMWEQCNFHGNLRGICAERGKATAAGILGLRPTGRGASPSGPRWSQAVRQRQAACAVASDRQQPLSTKSGKKATRQREASSIYSRGQKGHTGARA